MPSGNTKWFFLFFLFFFLLFIWLTFALAFPYKILLEQQSCWIWWCAKHKLRAPLLFLKKCQITSPPPYYGIPSNFYIILPLLFSSFLFWYVFCLLMPQVLNRVSTCSYSYFASPSSFTAGSLAALQTKSPNSSSVASRTHFKRPPSESAVCSKWPSPACRTCNVLNFLKSWSNSKPYFCGKKMYQFRVCDAPLPVHSLDVSRGLSRLLVEKFVEELLEWMMIELLIYLYFFCAYIGVLAWFCRRKSSFFSSSPGIFKAPSFSQAIIGQIVVFLLWPQTLSVLTSSRSFERQQNSFSFLK